MPVIEFVNVSKTFPRLRGQLLLRNRLAHWLKRDRSAPFYALRNVTFRVDRGESLAVIGPNGAGKSTLLGLAAGLAQPDEGEVSVCGRVAALLELGSGFHPDLTGLENVRLNASLLGLTRQETARVFDKILEFAEIGDYIQEPLRTYSSGMVMRLAFSVAVHIDPEVLIIDEVLAVGDQSFQAKCFDKVHELRRQGKTLICVSHAAGMVQQLCDRAIWLEHGHQMLTGGVWEVTEAYAGRQAATTA